MEQQGLTEREFRAMWAFHQRHALLQARFEWQRQASSGLSSADYSVLAVLSSAAEGRLRAHEVSRMVGWEKGRLRHQLTRMCTRGLITRERCGFRGMYAVITAKGLAALKEAVVLRLSP
jgi:DNA-binding MarR family transcriptional regulator